MNPEEKTGDRPKCPTCGLVSDDPTAIYCSSAFHFTSGGHLSKLVNPEEKTAEEHPWIAAWEQYRKVNLDDYEGTAHPFKAGYLAAMKETAVDPRLENKAQQICEIAYGCVQWEIEDGEQIGNMAGFDMINFENNVKQILTEYAAEQVKKAVSEREAEIREELDKKQRDIKELLKVIAGLIKFGREGKLEEYIAALKNRLSIMEDLDTIGTKKP